MEIHHRHNIEPYQTKDTSLIREILHPSSSTVQHQSLAEATVPSGATTQAHFHPQSEEIYYVLSGSGEFALNAEQSTLIAGDAVVIPPGTKHQIRNNGHQDLVFLCCCAPPYSHDDTILCDSLFEEPALEQ
jgi:mannose-6-phosphate isomerase-like protein (cupin superfamily)